MKLSKRILAVLLSVSMLMSTLCLTAGAEGSNVSFTVDKETVEVGDTVTVTISNEQMKLTGFGAIFEFDNTKLTCTNITGADGDEYMGIYKSSGKSPWVDATAADNVDNTNSDGKFSFTIMNGTETEYAAGTVATLTFKATAAGTVEFKLKEESAADTGNGYKGEAGTKTLTITEAVMLPNVSFVVDKETAQVGDSVTVTISNELMKLTGFGAIFEFDSTKLTCTNITGADGDEYMGLYKSSGKSPWVDATAVDNVENTNSDGKFSFTIMNGTETEYAAGIVATLTFEAIAAGTVEFKLKEESAADTGNGYKGEAGTKTLTILKAPIAAVSVAELAAPVKGAAPDTEVTVTPAALEATVAWTDAAGNPVTGNFAANTVYTAKITLTAVDGDNFAETVTAEGYTVTRNSATEIVLTKTFPATADKSLTKVEITTDPTKTKYAEGEKFDAAGMVVTATYDDDSTAEVTDYTVSPETMAKGTTEVTVSYGGFSDTVAVKVLPLPVLSDFDITLPVGAVYDSDAKTATVIGKAGMGDITVYYNGKTTAPVDAGTYEVTFDVAAGTDYAAVKGLKAGSFVIGQAENSWSVPVSIEGWKYLDTPNAPKGKDSMGGETVFTYLDADGKEVTDISKAGADTYTLKATVAETANWTGLTETVTFTIAKADASKVTYTAVEKTLLSDKVATGSVDYTYDLSGITANVQDAGKLAFSLNVTESTYADNLSIEGTTLKFTVEEPQAAGTKDSITVTVNSENYDETTVEVPLVFMDKTSVTVTLADITVTYGDSYAPAGVYAGATDASSKWTYTYSDFSGEGQPTAVGTYTITATYEDSIVENGIPGHVGTATAKLTINPKEVAAVWGTTEFTYTGAEQVPTATAAGVNETLTLAVSGAAADAGTYTATASLANSNYTLTNTTQAFTIAPKTVAVEWTNTEFTYDSTEKTPTATVSGFVVGDDVALAVTGAQTNAGTASAKAALTGADAANYAIKAGTDSVSFTVKPLPVALSWTDYASFEYQVNDEKTVTAAVTNAQGSDVVTVTGYTGNKATNAGTYTAKATALSNANYTLTGSATASYEWTITPATVALSWSGYETRTYDGTASNVTAQIVGDSTLTVTVVGGTESNAGTHTATATLSSPNYKPTPESLTKQYKINQASRNLEAEGPVLLVPGALTATIKAQADDLDGSLKYKYKSDNSSAITVNGKGLVTAKKNGEATITVKVDETTNYEEAYVDVAVSGVVDPITDVKVTGGEGMKAKLKGTKIEVSGTVTGEDGLKALTYSFTEADVDGIDIDVDPADGKVADGKVTVIVNDGEPITYTVDTSKVTVLPDNVDVEETTKKNENNKEDKVEKVEGAKDALPQDIIDAIVAAVTEAVEITIKVEAEVTVDEDGKISIDLTYSATTGEGADETPVVNSTPVPALTQSVTVKLDDNSSSASYVKHENNGVVKFLPVAADGTFETDSVDGTFDIVKDEDVVSTKIAFQFYDGSEQIETYTLANVNDPLPTDSASGYSFKGWDVGGKTYTTVTEELLKVTPADGETAVVATSIMDPVSSGSSSGGGGKVTTYAITVKDTDNGEVTASAKSAKKGATVTITVKPDKGYELDKLTVTDKNGDKITVKEKNGKYTFTMPASKVTVKATFQETDVVSSFSDVAENAYYFDAVEWAVAEGITTGYANGTFLPNNTCTRAQTVTFLWRAMGEPEPETTEMPFTDVVAGSYYYDAVLWAVENGITSGMTATTFAPNKTVTRAQTVTFLWRTAKMEGYDVSVGAETNILSYADAHTIGEYAIPAMQWACGEEIMGGYNDGTLRPNVGCTRAQIVTFLYRFLG